MVTASLVDVSLAVEAELDRLRTARPHLASRIARVGHILCTHLSCRRQRVIRVWITANGKQYFFQRIKGRYGLRSRPVSQLQLHMPWLTQRSQRM
jgi:hypothetical protein